MSNGQRADRQIFAIFFTFLRFFAIFLRLLLFSRWNESSPGDLCFRRDCYLEETDRMVRGCVPVHMDGECCPAK